MLMHSWPDPGTLSTGCVVEVSHPIRGLVFSPSGG